MVLPVQRDHRVHKDQRARRGLPGLKAQRGLKAQAAAGLCNPPTSRRREPSHGMSRQEYPEHGPTSSVPAVVDAAINRPPVALAVVREKRVVGFRWSLSVAAPLRAL